MKISPSELHSLCQLTHLAPGSTELEALNRELNAIMDFVDQLKINTDGVAPMFHPMDMHQVLRPDVVTEKDCLEELAELAPLFEDGHFLVPKVLDSGK